MYNSQWRKQDKHEEIYRLFWIQKGKKDCRMETDYIFRMEGCKGWYHLKWTITVLLSTACNTDHYVWESVAEFATNVKPII